MDFSQRKLSKKEWESLEMPIRGPELEILKLIKMGFDNVNIRSNNTQTLFNYIKFNKHGTHVYHKYLYDIYFKKKFDKYVKKYNIQLDNNHSKNTKSKKARLKKADIIRISNTDSKIKRIKSTIFEFILLSLFEKYLNSGDTKKNKYYYTLIHLFKFNISNINTIVKQNIIINLSNFCPDKCVFIQHASEYIETNECLLKYKDIELFTHQKDLFTHCKNDSPKLLLYQSPTGTGKTLSPIGLSTKYKIIFVCAAKHVGLQLAKACISMDIKIAVAFGCTDSSNIRLHWNAKKEFIRNRRTGGVFKVDNTVGDNVEIMISDVKSYLDAMYYMLAFNEPQNIILFWDEPTITLDCIQHEYHETIHQNWTQNEIPNIILSSATLPPIDRLTNLTRSFVRKFNSTNVISLKSYKCIKTIPLVGPDGYYMLPHLYFDTLLKIKKCVSHLKQYLTLLRHFDISEITRFIMYVNNNNYINHRYTINQYFEDVTDIDIVSIKMYYLELLNNLGENYVKTHLYLKSTRLRTYDSSNNVTTSDAHTLTDGPTIYMANDVDTIGDHCLSTAAIPQLIYDSITQNIESNCDIVTKMNVLLYKITKNTDNLKQTKQSTELNTSELLLRTQCEFLNNKLKHIQLDAQYIPNSIKHLQCWGCSHIINAFTSIINEKTAQQIMMLSVDSKYKLLLLMGIGIFSNHIKNDDYVAIMKELALNQRLYLIIASTDYIYGTNYQFIHGILGTDLELLSQEKLIQACGRIGRSDINKQYSIRIQHTKLINTLLTTSDNNIEVNNMNKIFT
jgi:hypothetical protein